MAVVLVVVTSGCSSSLLISNEGLSPPPAAPVEKPAAPPLDRAITSTATASIASAPETSANVENLKQFVLQPVLWATTRKLDETTEAGLVFTSDRSQDLTFGVAKVSIPKKQRVVGEIKVPTDVRVLDISVYKQAEDPRYHFTVQKNERLDEAAFLAAANDMHARSRVFKGHAFVFVHGYWNTFESALFRTAQMAFDMGFDGVPYLYSWPSKGEMGAYLWDRDSVDGDRENFLKFLDMVASTGATKIHVIAHSMGSRLVFESLFPGNTVGARKPLPKLDQIVLCAPDLENSIVERRTIPSLRSPITIYASKDDQALMASRSFAGGAPRIGEVYNGKPFIRTGFETIDISQMQTSIFDPENHSKYATKAHMLKDLANLLLNGTHPPTIRFPVYSEVKLASGVYWQYVKN